MIKKSYIPIQIFKKSVRFITMKDFMHNLNCKKVSSNNNQTHYDT